MENNYSSLDLLAQFSQSEQAELESLGLESKADSPSASSISNILGYSKALSIRKAGGFGKVEVILN